MLRLRRCRLLRDYMLPLDTLRCARFMMPRYYHDYTCYAAPR